jgi:hypothetical protein
MSEMEIRGSQFGRVVWNGDSFEKGGEFNWVADGWPLAKVHVHPCGKQHFREIPTPDFYAPQTKILEGGTKDEIRIFAALFNG